MTLQAPCRLRSWDELVGAATASHDDHLITLIWICREEAAPYGGASCHRFWANQLRLLLAALAYGLKINLRRHSLVGTELAQARTATIRVKLLKIAAAIVRNIRRVRVLLASGHPRRAVFASAAHALAA